MVSAIRNETLTENEAAPDLADIRATLARVDEELERLRFEGQRTKALSFEKERLVKVDWGRTQQLYPVRLRVEAWDRVGLLRDMTSLVSEQKVNIASVVSTEHEDSTCTISLTVHIKDVEQLSRLFSRLEGVRGVVSVARSNFYEFVEGQRSTSG